MSARHREIRFEPGYDHREADKTQPDANKRYGAHGLQMRWLLHGENVTVQFLVYTGWLPSWVKETDRWKRVPFDIPDRIFPPMAADLGHHADRPTFDGEWQRESCEFRPGGRCFYDGSGTGAERLLAALLTDGHEAVWTLMAEYLDYCEAEMAEHAARIAEEQRRPVQLVDRATCPHPPEARTEEFTVDGRSVAVCLDCEGCWS